ncbi:hypothetical protein FHS12_003944 [Nocardioides albus]|uniref:Uncharacterized protein n=1 Tax=Nocardioides albus TaxID=1841 RepID=A0A7W5A7G7_9ACTN|nr:hypothetical protein [Nocardioides albus]
MRNRVAVLEAIGSPEKRIRTPAAEFVEGNHQTLALVVRAAE